MKFTPLGVVLLILRFSAVVAVPKGAKGGGKNRGGGDDESATPEHSQQYVLLPDNHSADFMNPFVDEIRAGYNFRKMDLEGSKVGPHLRYNALKKLSDKIQDDVYGKKFYSSMSNECKLVFCDAGARIGVSLCSRRAPDHPNMVRVYGEVIGSIVWEWLEAVGSSKPLGNQGKWDWGATAWRQTIGFSFWSADTSWSVNIDPCENDHFDEGFV
ncbi:hypothetical protein ABW19_dt0208486 [Dactylella cylindrospora]|nr:hypothetical protein ABW19_dt0208486 [Dactylella cylindrospora]